MSNVGLSNPFKPCTCDKCGVKEVSMPGKQHRRCSGNTDNATLRDKAEKLPSTHRGRWS